MRPLNNTPPWLVKNGRVVDFGLFRTPFRNLNITQTQPFRRWHSAPQWLRNVRLKEWQHLAVVSKDFAMGLAIVDTHYMGNSFCYFVDRTTGRHFQHQRQSGSGAAIIARELWRDGCLFDKPGYRIEIDNHLEEGLHRVRIGIQATGDAPEITAEFELLEDLNTLQPLIAVLPTSGPNRPMYTHKAPCPVRGSMTVDGNHVTLDPQNDFALIDVQKSFYLYNTWWNWATCVGRDAKGRVIALNLVRNFFEDDERYNENCLWVDGALTTWSAARFSFNKRDLMSPWQIETTDGRCRLEFRPQGDRAENINLGLIRSDFHQPFGLFSGRVVDDAGNEYEIEDFYGVCEHHIARF